jgi:hypothetical protein
VSSRYFICKIPLKYRPEVEHQNHLPLADPGLRSPGGFSKGTSLATGFPDFAMMISSPAIAWLINFENFDFASYIFT